MTAFDTALEQAALRAAAEAYASRRGQPGSDAYREARIRFLARKTSEDLRHRRATETKTSTGASARKRPATAASAARPPKPR